MHFNLTVSRFRAISSKGFSLIELMIVVAIMGILVAVALPQFTSMAEDSKRAKARTDIDTLVQAISRFNTMEGRPIAQLNDLAGRYMADIDSMKDPWGSPYTLNTGTGDVISKGSDQVEGTRDDIRMSYIGPLRLVDAIYTPMVFGGDTPDTKLDDRDELLLVFNKPVGNIALGGAVTEVASAAITSLEVLKMTFSYPRKDNSSTHADDDSNPATPPVYIGTGATPDVVHTSMDSAGYFADADDGTPAMEVDPDDAREIFCLISNDLNIQAVAGGWGIVPNSTQINLLADSTDRNSVFLDGSYTDDPAPEKCGAKPSGTDVQIRQN